MYKFAPQRAFGSVRAKASRKHILLDANKHLKELVKSGRVDEARKVFDQMSDRDEFTWNTMVSGYANSGRPVEARRLFDESPRKSTIAWSCLVCGYSKMGCEAESFQLLYEMLHDGYSPNRFTLGSILRLCSIKSLLSRGEQVHALAMKARLDKDVFIVTGLIDLYAKCLHIVEAEYLFERMSSEGKNHVTWTAMLNGYSLNGDIAKTIECFAGMRENGVEANQYTFPGVLMACGARSDLGFGTQVHGCVFRGGFAANVFVQSALVDMYTKCGDLSGAMRIVNSMESNDLISWNALILGCVRHGLPERALSLFKSMHGKGMGPDEFTYPSVLNSLALVKNAMAGKNIHSLVVKSGFEFYTLVSNALIDMYAKQENLGDAFSLFDILEERDVISWTSLITGCAHCGSHEEALELYHQMRSGSVPPDRVLASSILSSCSELTWLNLGQQIHSDCIKLGLDSSLSVENSLMSLYSNCGCLECAEKIFDSMEIRNVISWTALIVGYAQNGQGTKSLQLYDQMIASGLKPDFITFIGLLFACSHKGLTEQGRYYFDSMVKDHGITPGPDHYACMIDLLGRSGKIAEMEKLLNEMTIKPDAALWKSLLSACRVHGNIDLAEKAATALVELDPRDSVPYVMLSNIYSQNGKWDEAARIRKLMKSRGVGKEPGRSWMEVDGKVHTFLPNERNHPEAGSIFSKIEEVMGLIKGAGYVPDVKFALHDVNEESKAHGLAYHSEKLAVAFGLLKLPAGSPIRIYKNIRICGDCHSAMKFVSRVYGRRVILRDSNCFHHFGEGVCSCADYW